MSFEKYQPKGLAQISITDLVNLAGWKTKKSELARANNNIELAMFYERQAEEIDFIIDFVINEEVKFITNLTLPMRNLKALTFDEAKIVETIDTQKKIEFTFDNAKTIKAKVDIVLNNPAVRAEQNIFAKRVEEVANIKIKTELDLFDTMLKDNNVKLIRSHLLSFLGNGRRQDAVKFLIEHVFKHKNYTEYQAHQLLNKLKDTFKTKEPRLSLDYVLDEKDVKNYRPVPMGEWIFALYKTGAIIRRRLPNPTGKGYSETTSPEQAYGYMRIEKSSLNDMMHNYHDQPLCRVGNITRWRLATRYEINNVIALTKPVDFDNFNVKQ